MSSPTNINLNDTVPPPKPDAFNVEVQAGAPYPDPNVPGAVVRDASFCYRTPQVGGVLVLTDVYDLGGPDAGFTFVCNSATPFTITHPAVIPVLPNPQGIWNFKLLNLGAGTVTLDLNGLNLDGSGTNPTYATGEGAEISTDGTDLYTCLSSGTGGGGSSTLAADTDVSISSPADRDLLIYHSSDSKWHNDVLVAGVSSVFGRTGAVVAVKTDYYTRTAVSTNTSLAAAAGITVIEVTTGASNLTETLPAASGNDGVKFLVKKVDSGAGTVTLAGNGAETIDGSNTQVLTGQWAFIEVVCNGTSWDIKGTSLASKLTGVVAIANGGTGTTSPGLVAGANVVVTGSWPNQTIAATTNAGAGGPPGIVLLDTGIITDTVSNAAGDFAHVCTISANSLSYGSELWYYAEGTEVIVSGDDHKFGVVLDAGTWQAPVGHSSFIGTFAWSLKSLTTIGAVGASGFSLPASSGIVSYVWQENNGSSPGAFTALTGSQNVVAFDTTVSHTLKIHLGGTVQSGSSATLKRFVVIQIN